MEWKSENELGDNKDWSCSANISSCFWPIGLSYNYYHLIRSLPNGLSVLQLPPDILTQRSVLQLQLPDITLTQRSVLQLQLPDITLTQRSVQQLLLPDINFAELVWYRNVKDH